MLNNARIMDAMDSPKPFMEATSKVFAPKPSMNMKHGALSSLLMGKRE